MPTTVLLNGSPHEKGDSMTLARTVLDAAGGEARIVNLYQLRIAPCAACGHCRHEAGCAFDAQDDMPVVRSPLHAADRLMIASPLHFSSLSAPLVTAFGRLQPEWRAAVAPGAERPARGKGALALAGGGLYPNMFEGARIVAAAVFRTLGFAFTGLATVSGTDGLPARDNREALARAAELGEKLR